MRDRLTLDTSRWRMGFALLLVCALSSLPKLTWGANGEPTDTLRQFLSTKGLIARWHPSNKEGLSLSSQVSLNAIGLIGVPYIWGGSKTSLGLDCSGLVQAVFRQTAGIRLPRVSSEQAAASQPIDVADMRPGDLVFFNTMRRPFSHVGIYVGDGKFVHAPKPGARVRISDMRRSYWTRRFEAAHRVATPPLAEQAFAEIEQP